MKIVNASTETPGAVACLLSTLPWTAIEQPQAKLVGLLFSFSFLRLFFFVLFSKWSPFVSVSHSSEFGVM